MLRRLAKPGFWSTQSRTDFLVIQVQPYPNLFDKHELICMNEVAQVEPVKIFWLLIANFGNQSHQALKRQVVASVPINHTRLGKSTLTKRKVLDMVYELPTAWMDSN